MSVQSILEKLNKLISIHEKLLELSKEKTNIVKEGNAEKLQAKLIQERKMVLQLAQVEESRQKEVDEWFSVRGLSNEEATVTNLINNIENDEEKRLLAEKAVYLTEVVVNLKQQEQLNMALIQQSMQFVQLSIDLLSPSLKNINYSKDKEGESQINRSVFDSKA
ncbi:flagellar protein FlgN [Ornithinibacillus sp. 179-J 7C1 HS]|uniref:flagellar protein FlgN n=1 Tax=Ornithinibacillus sp. 179-J 7C1 HS TaxID=3142384 RepID=UPI00399FD361